MIQPLQQWSGCFFVKCCIDRKGKLLNGLCGLDEPTTVLFVIEEW